MNFFKNLYSLRQSLYHSNYLTLKKNFFIEFLENMELPTACFSSFNTSCMLSSISLTGGQRQRL